VIVTADGARIVTMPATLVAVPITDTVQHKRLIEFASDVNRLADQRVDLDLRELIDGLHADLLDLRTDDDD
jgi:hypothetical protein